MVANELSLSNTSELTCIIDTIVNTTYVLTLTNLIILDSAFTASYRVPERINTLHVIIVRK